MGSTGDQEGDQLQRIQARAAKLLRLDSAIKKAAPASLAPWFRVANYRDATLILEVASPAWQLRLRQALPKMEHELKNGLLPSLQSIEVRVNNEVGKEAGKRGDVSVLSADSAAVLEYVAQDAPEELKAALERLANHGKS